MSIIGRRLVAALLSAAILIVSPGLDCYQAFGAQMGRRAVSIRLHPALGRLEPRRLPRPVAGPGLPASAAARALAAPGRMAMGQAPRKHIPHSAAQGPQRSGAATRAAGGGLSRAARDPEAAAAASAARFDGSARKPSEGLSVKAVRGAVISGVLGLMLSAPGRAIPIEGRSDPIATPSAPAEPAPAPAVVPAPPAPLAPSPVAVELSVDRQGATVGERLRLSVTLKNGSEKPVSVAGLRASLREALPESLEVQGEDGEEPIRLGPGEEKTVVIEVVPFDAGHLKVGGSVKLTLVEGGSAVKVEAALKESAVEVQTVLPPDWRRKGFRDMAGAMRPESSQPGPLAAVPLLLVLLAGAERLLAARRSKPGAPISRAPLLEKTRLRLAALENPAGPLGASAFYAEAFSILSDFLVDFHGLPTRERDARSLLADLEASGRLGPGQLQVAADLARRSQAVRFGGRAASLEDQRRDLVRLKALIESVSDGAAGQAGAPGRAAGLSGLAALLPGAAALQFGNPLALLLFVPWAGYLAIQWLNRRQAAARGAYSLSSTADLPGRRSLRERLAWLPAFLRASALAAFVAALARPQLGITRQASVIPSTDTVISLDLSGSMDTRFSDDAGRQGSTKLDAAKEAVRAFVEEPTPGATNRTGLVTFADDPYLDLPLTSDRNALIAHLKELKTSGSTAVGKSMLAAIAHFVELNAAELGKSDHALAPEFQKVLSAHGLGAALQFAKPYPDLTEKVLRPERKKVVVLFTDGESNTGIAPFEAAAIAKKLGVRVYTVGIAPKGEGVPYGLDEATLKGVAQATGARYYRAGDAEAMRDVLLEIGRLEKNLVHVVSSVSVKDFEGLLVLLALAALSLELALANTRLRVLNGVVAVFLPLAALGGLAPQARAQESRTPQVLPLKGLPPEMLSGNLLYNQGRYDEALRLYAQALENHPGLAEAYFNLGNAQLRLGDAEGAAASYRKFLGAAKAPALASKAYYNLGAAALARRDAASAIEMYKQALRQDPGNFDAKWNLEILRKVTKQQGQGGGKGKPQRGGQGDQKGQPQPQGDDREKPSPQAQPKDDGKSAAEQLAESLGRQEKEEQEAARKSITREGTRMWGLAALPLSFGGAAVVFSSPALLWVTALLIPVLAGLLAYGLHQRLKAARLLSPGQAPRDLRSWPGLRRAAAKAALALGAAGLLGLAAAGPQSGLKDERLNFGGNDIMVALDGSHSMVYAEDGRLARARKELADFSSRLRGADRVGLVVFAGEPRTASPASIDYGIFEYKAERLEKEVRGLNEGSNIVAAVEHAAASFETLKPIPGRRRVMILISDGDFFDSELEDAVKAARERGVAVYTIGIGSPSGVRMSVPKKEGPGTEYLVDRKTSQPAVTRLNEQPLRELARATGGAYFRVGTDGTIDRILKSVAEHQRGETGAALKAPRSVAAWLLWPGLLLLGLDWLLAAKPLLKGARRAGAPMAAGLVMGATGVSLSAWPMILAFSAALTAVSGVLLADYWSGGALGRRLRWLLERRRGLVRKGLAADATQLFDIRESDAPSLAAFLSAWAKASEADKPRLIGEASGDAQLWRQKLLAAYLYGNAPETQESLLAAMRIAAKRHLQSVEPVVVELLSRREKVQWLEHVDAAGRLARAAEAFLDPARAAALAAPGGRAPSTRPAPSWRRRAAAALSVLGFTGLLAATGYSGAKSLEFRRERARAVDEAERIFFGEDHYIFSDRYVDESIPRLVLPALRAAWRDAPQAERRLDLAVAALARSVDPKADNVLEALFKHPEAVALSERAEAVLLATLLARDNARVWQVIDERMSLSAENPRMLARLVKVLMLLVQKGDEKSFQNLFRFLKAPSDQIRQMAAQAIYSGLTAKPVEEHFFRRLGAVQAAYSADPLINLWIEQFVLARLATAPVKGGGLAEARALLDAVFEAGTTYEVERAKAYAAAGPGEEDQIPPSYLETALGFMAGVEKGAPPFALADTVKYTVNRTATALIAEGEKIYPELREKLFDAGLVPTETVPAAPLQSGRFGRGRGRGRADTTHYRELYKLGQLRELKRLIAEAGSEAAASGGGSAESREFLNRADKALEKMLVLGQASGMLEGASPGEKLAEEVNKLLDEDFGSVPDALRAAGLAYDNGAPGAAKWRESYGLEDLRAIRKVFADAAAAGSLGDYYGEPSALDSLDKLYLVKALDALDALIAKNDPAARRPMPMSPERAFWRSLKYPGQEKLVLTRMGSASYGRPADMEFQYRLLGHLARRLSGPQGKDDSLDEAADVIENIFNAALKNGKTAETLSELARLARKAPAGSPFASVARRQVQKMAERLIIQAVEYYQPGFGKRLVDREVRTAEYGGERSEYKQTHLRGLLAAIEEAAREARRKQKTGLTASQSATLERARKLLPGIIAAGAAAGLASGDTPAELAADKANDILYEGYYAFKMAVPYIDGLRAAGLAPKNGRYSRDDAFFDRYSKEDLIKVRKYLADMLASGQARNYDSTPLRLEDKEKTYLEKAIKDIDGVIARYGKAAPAAKPGGVKLRDLGVLGLALTAPGAALWIAAVLAAGLLTWGVYKAFQYWRGRREKGLAQMAPSAPSEDVFHRYQKIELAARKLASSVSPGAFRTLFIGSGGGEFAESRPYTDEDAREIDWRASARLGETYAKKYELEKEMPLLLLVDQSGSGSFGTQGADKKTVIQDSAAVLALAAAHHGLRVGAVLFTDTVEAFIAPRGGMDNARDLVRRIVGHEPQGRGTDLRAALQLVLGRFSARTLTAIVSDFIAPDFGQPLAALAARHDLRAIRVSDPAEARPIPDVGLISLRDAETGEVRLADTSDRAFREELSARHARSRAALAEALSHAGLREISVSTEGDYLGALGAQFDPKMKSQ